jgi:hypothetical protein
VPGIRIRAEVRVLTGNREDYIESKFVALTWHVRLLNPLPNAPCTKKAILMKANPGKLGAIVQQIVALNGKQVIVIDHQGGQYEGLLKVQGEMMIKGFDVVKAGPSGEQPLISVSPLTRVVDLNGSLVEVDLSTMLDVWFQEKGGIREETFFASSVDGIKLHAAKKGDHQSAKKAAVEHSADEGANGNDYCNTYRRTKYLRKGDAIRSVSIVDGTVVVWVDSKQPTASKE